MPCCPGLCKVGAVEFESVGWGLPSRKLVHDRGERDFLLPHVLGIQDKDQLGVLHPIFHKEEGKGHYQCFGKGSQDLEGREGWDSEKLGAQGWCARSRAPQTSSLWVPFPSFKVSHSWEKEQWRRDPQVCLSLRILAEGACTPPGCALWQPETR